VTPALNEETRTVTLASGRVWAACSPLLVRQRAPSGLPGPAWPGTSACRGIGCC
jgi:hypothetical protein